QPTWPQERPSRNSTQVSPVLTQSSHSRLSVRLILIWSRWLHWLGIKSPSAGKIIADPLPPGASAPGGAAHLLARFLARNFCALLARLGKPNGNSLLAALDLVLARFHLAHLGAHLAV